MSGEEVNEESLAKDEGLPRRPGLAGAPYIVYVGLGANLGDRRASLRRALRLLAHLEDTRLVCASSFYETPPFLNACAALRTRLLPLVLLRAVQRIECALGRVRREHWGPRTIDVDLLFAEGWESASPELRLPHPHLHERAFVLLPLAEIAPGLSVRGREVGDWLNGLSERSVCRRRSSGYCLGKR